MKKTLISSIILIFNIYSFGQNLDYSISLKYNQPYTNSIEKTPYVYLYSPSTAYSTYFSNAGIKETYNSKPGIKFSGNFSYNFNSHLFLEGGLQLNLIRFQQETEVLTTSLSEFEIVYDIEFQDSLGNPLYPIIIGQNIVYEDQDKLGNTSALYSEIPIQIGYSFFNNKLKCKIGLITSFLAYAEVYVYDKINSIDYTTISVKKDKTGDGFTNLMWNGNIELEYLVFEKIGLSLGYTRSLNSFYDESVSIGSPKYNLFSIGITYNFLN
jgi:hypothetical protein